MLPTHNPPPSNVLRSAVPPSQDPNNNNYVPPSQNPNNNNYVPPQAAAPVLEQGGVLRAQILSRMARGENRGEQGAAPEQAFGFKKFADDQFRRLIACGNDPEKLKARINFLKELWPEQRDAVAYTLMNMACNLQLQGSLHKNFEVLAELARQFPLLSPSSRKRILLEIVTKIKSLMTTPGSGFDGGMEDEDDHGNDVMNVIEALAPHITDADGFTALRELAEIPFTMEEESRLKKDINFQLSARAYRALLKYINKLPSDDMSRQFAAITEKIYRDVYLEDGGRDEAETFITIAETMLELPPKAMIEEFKKLREFLAHRLRLEVYTIEEAVEEELMSTLIKSCENLGRLPPHEMANEFRVLREFIGQYLATECPKERARIEMT
jgi:hypothetical protein